MGVIASQITSLMIVYSTVYSDADQRKHQSSASLAFMRGIHRGPVNSLHKWPVTWKMFPFDDVIMVLKLILLIDSWGISVEIVLLWMSLYLIDDKSTLVQLMVWCHVISLSGHYSGTSLMRPSKSPPQKHLNFIICPHQAHLTLDMFILYKIIQYLFPLLWKTRAPSHGTKPLPEPMLTQIYVAIWCH